MKEAFTLTRGQKKARLHALRGKNLFITGGSGTGKSACLLDIIQALEASGKKVLVCAPTGSAALRLGAMTVHSLFGFPPDVCINPGGKRKAPTIKVRTPQVLRAADTVAIDEISMVRIDVFHAVVASIQKAEAETGRHIQLIVAGDFLQLSPVLGSDYEKNILGSFYGKEMGGGYAFMAQAWDQCRFYTVILDEVVRQKERPFIDCLNRIRAGDPGAIGFLDPAASREAPDGLLSLYAYRQPVDQANKRQLEKLGGKLRTFKAIIELDPRFPPESGIFKTLEGVPKDLTLAEGAAVTFTCNDRPRSPVRSAAGLDPWLFQDKNTGYYVNGMSGTVLWLPDGTGSDPRPVIVRTETGKVVEVCPVTQPVYRSIMVDGEAVRVKIASVIQLPLMLGYSMTIHHAQGQTFDHARICPDTFAPGQLYVALSRVRTPDGIYLTRPIKPADIIVDPAVLEFYSSLRDGQKSRKVGRPVQENGAKNRMLHVPRTLLEHVKEEIRCNRIIPLEKMPPYQEGRAHVRIQDSLYEEVRIQIAQWKRSQSGHTER